MKNDRIATVVTILILLALVAGIFLLPDAPIVDVDGTPLQEREL